MSDVGTTPGNSCPPHFTATECTELQAILNSPPPPIGISPGWLAVAVILGFLAWNLRPGAE